MIHALIKIEPIILNLESTVGIMTHLVDGEVESVHPDEWNNLLNDMRRGCSRSSALGHRMGGAEGRGGEARGHADRSRAEKAAPGSKEDVKRADALWRLLSSLVGVAGEQCSVAGYPPRPPPTMAEIGFRRRMRSHDRSEASRGRSRRDRSGRR